MILRRLLAVLADRRGATPDELARLLGSSPDAVRDMLQTLQRRGLVQRLPTADCGRRCHDCGLEVEHYTVDEDNPDEPPCGTARA